MKILLISYYFPPCGGAPVQRWLRFIPYLIERGHHITVITSKNGDYPFIDSRLCRKVPPSVKVIRVPALGMGKIWKLFAGKSSSMPYGNIPKASSLISKVLIWMRLNLIIPDLRVFWNPPAWRATIRELRRFPYDLLITTGPPHSSHLIGLKLSPKTHLKWYTDFRDPYLNIHYMKLNPPSRLTRSVHRYLEKKILASANLNIVVSQAIADAMPTGKKVVIHNGFDIRDFAALKHHPAPHFRIKYVGQFTAGQNLNIICELCSQLKRDFKLSLIGTRLSVAEETKLKNSCKDKLCILPFLPHEQALQQMVDSDLLLLIVNEYEGNSGVLTTKLFEYLASRSPILCFSSEDSAAGQIIKECKAGHCFGYQQVAEAVKWVEKLSSSQRTEGDIFTYSVEHQIDILEEALVKQNID